ALSTCEGLDFHYKTTKSSNKPTKPTSDSPSSPTTVPENPSSTAAPENPSSPAPENPNNPNNPSPQPTPDPNNPNNPPPANPNPSNPNPTTSLPGLLIFYQPSDGKTSITGYLNNLLDDVEGKYTFKIVNDKGTVINDLTGMINPIFQLGGSSTFSTIQDSVRLSGDPATNALGSFFVITQRDVAICKALIGKEFVIDGLGALSTCEGLDFHYKTTKSSNKPTKPTSDSPSSPTTVPENPSSTAAPENPSSPAPENPNNPNNPSPQPTPDPNNPNNPPPANPNPSNPNPTTSLPDFPTVLASAKVASDVAPPVPLKNGKMTGLLIFYQPSDGKTSITGYLNNLLDDVEGKYTFKIVNDKGTVINDLTGMINPIFQLGGSSTFSTIQDSVRLSGDPATNALGSFFVITQRDVAICKALIGKEFVIDG
ncbi:10943_t:CDS:2, partial [Entrophospora sp. SA101]